MTELKQMGLSPYWCQVDLGEQGKWFRVFVGYFPNRYGAKEFMEKHSFTSGLISKTTYAVRVGTYSSDIILGQKTRLLEKCGYSPYVIGDAVKGFQLLTGAFVTQEAADNLAQDLKETGIDCKVILR
jgi:cell division septation protein DedD